MASIVAGGVRDDELAKAKTVRAMEMLRGRETAEAVAGEMGEQALIGGDASRANSELAKLNAVTGADVQAVATKYLLPTGSTTLLVTPDPLGVAARKSAAAAAAITRGNAPVAAPPSRSPRALSIFPKDIPSSRRSPGAFNGCFRKGPGNEGKWRPRNRHVRSSASSGELDRDDAARQPWRSGRQGGDGRPHGRDAAARAGSYTFAQLNEYLESHGIALDIADGGDVTTLNGSCATAELDHAVSLSRTVLRSPSFTSEEFDKLKEHTMNSLVVDQDSPLSVADHELRHALYGPSPLGKTATPSSVAGITLDDVKNSYQEYYRPDDAILTLSGDISVEHSAQLAHEITDGWQPRGSPPVRYSASTAPSQRRIILVDNPTSRGVVIAMGLPAYDLHDDQKFAGSLANVILSSGIESRLMR